MDAKKLLSINDLTVYYGKKIACSNICLTLNQGERLGILGESGAGKSSLAKAIAGINKGYDGELIRNFTQCGYVFQDPAASLNPAMKVGRLLKEPLILANNIKDAKDIIPRTLNQVGLPQDYANRYPDKLSGGEKQRLAIAIALQNKPQLLIADEPISALDKVTGEQIMALFQRFYNELNFGFIFVSHNLLAIKSFCDKVIVMKDGRMVEVGGVREVFFNPKSEYTKRLVLLSGIN